MNQPTFGVGTAPPLEARLDLNFPSMDMGVNTGRLKRERRDILYWLDAKTDAELAMMGQAWPEFPTFVFRDQFGP